MEYPSQLGGAAGRASQNIPLRREPDMKVVEDLVAYFKEYARERPEMCALTCLGIGFVLGWRLKPW